MTGKKKNKKIHFLITLAIFIAVAFALVLFWAYSGNISPAKRKLFKLVPLPAAIVNYHFIPMQDYLDRSDSAKIILTSEKQNFALKDLQKTIFLQILSEEKTIQTAKKFGVFASKQEIDSEYINITKQSETENQNFGNLLKTYGLNENMYKNFVIKPKIVETNLQIWFNNQSGLNPETYGLAKNLTEKIKNGENFGELAKNFTSDTNGKSTGGDLGFVDTAEILPELKDAVTSMQKGETKTVASRFGLHILLLEERNNNKEHLRQIFLKTSDFNKWLNTQKNNISEIDLLRI